MGLLLRGVCLSHRGKVRRKNEDNYCCDGKIQKEDSDFSRVEFRRSTAFRPFCAAVFDGMGGERFGEKASCAAAKALQSMEKLFPNLRLPEDLENLTQTLNRAVWSEEKALLTSHMGTTMVLFLAKGRTLYACSLGDSRAYRLREGELTRLSKDHTEQRPSHPGGKPGLTQYLGIDPQEMVLEPSVRQEEMEPGDQYLLCSDGLTDMVSEEEIRNALSACASPGEGAETLLNLALEAGGADNITLMLLSPQELPGHKLCSRIQEILKRN